MQGPGPQTAFIGPDGEFTLDPRLEDIRLDDTEFWFGGSGSGWIGSIEFADPGFRILNDRPSLSIVVHHRYGVSFAYDGEGVRDMSFTSEVGPDLYVLHAFGGVDSLVPLASFLSHEAAVIVVSEFLRSSQVPTGSQWQQATEDSFPAYIYAKAD